jgi:hypothetical protein
VSHLEGGDKDAEKKAIHDFLCYVSKSFLLQYLPVPTLQPWHVCVRACVSCTKLYGATRILVLQVFMCAKPFVSKRFKSRWTTLRAQLLSFHSLREDARQLVRAEASTPFLILSTARLACSVR